MRERIALVALIGATCACIHPAVPVSGQAMPTQTPASSFEPLPTSTPAIGPPTSVDNILAQAREYDNKPVRAVGTARNVRTDATPAGPVLQFDLCGRRCIHVLDASNPTIGNETTATITGTFHRHFERGRFSQDDVILIIPGGLPPDDSMEWRRQLEGRYPPTPRPR